MLKLIASELVVGQLVSPLTSYRNWNGVFAIDNGAFTSFDGRAFRRLQERDREHAAKCLFVTCPDVVGSARRTLELFELIEERGFVLPGFPVALVAQDGIEDLGIPWNHLGCLFIGGTNAFKDSRDALDCVKTAKIAGKHVHVGRVNTAPRFLRFAAAGADTCDGSGIARFRHMLPQLAAAIAIR
jgi:hypothetical protein